MEFGPDLPRPDPGNLGIYVLGGGVGESIVSVLPDGRTMVMDACQQDGINLPGLLLRHLEKKKIDLLVVSHPDHDHVRGLAELIEEFDPTDVWRYPFDGTLREYAAKWCRSTGRRELAEAVEALDRHGLRTGRVMHAAFGIRSWPSPSRGYEVHALAPTHFDQQRARRVWSRLVTFEAGRMRASRWLEHMLLGHGSRALDVPNVVSLAVSIAWGSRRVLLGGDVLRGVSSPNSGWKGVLRLLDQEDLGHLVTDVDVVKLSHHGSHTGFVATAWDRHAFRARPVGMVAPFSPSRLPDRPTLSSLMPRVSRLLASSRAGGVDERLRATGWVVDSATTSTTTIPCVAVMLSASGEARLFAGAPAISAVPAAATPGAIDT